MVTACLPESSVVPTDPGCEALGDVLLLARRLPRQRAVPEHQVNASKVTCTVDARRGPHCTALCHPCLLYYRPQARRFERGKVLLTNDGGQKGGVMVLVVVAVMLMVLGSRLRWQWCFSSKAAETAHQQESCTDHFLVSGRSQPERHHSRYGNSSIYSA